MPPAFDCFIGSDAASVVAMSDGDGGELIGWWLGFIIGTIPPAEHGLVKREPASMGDADSHLLKTGIGCDLWVGQWVGLVVVIAAPTGHCGIVSGRTTVLVSGRDQIGWRDVIKRGSLTLCIGCCADQPNQKPHN